jgi:hypothetical protein
MIHPFDNGQTVPSSVQRMAALGDPRRRGPKKAEIGTLRLKVEAGLSGGWRRRSVAFASMGALCHSHEREHGLNILCSEK